MALLKNIFSVLVVVVLGTIVALTIYINPYKLTANFYSRRPLVQRLNEMSIYVNVSSKFQPMMKDENKDKLMERIKKTLQLPWKQNNTNRDALRQHLAELATAKHQFSLTQQNVRVGAKLKAAISNRDIRISREMFSFLPKRESFGTKRFNTCSIVGSSGILTNSGCGKQIDTADAVFRFNVAPIEEFSKDAGNKTTMNTINQSIYRIRYSSLQSQQNKSQFLEDMKQSIQDGFVWLPDYSLAWISKESKVGHVIFRKHGIKMVFMHPDHFRSITEAWQLWGIKGRISTGFYFISVAIELCDNIQVFGFWPFENGPNNTTLQYHYYNDLTSSDHDFPHEFLMLYELHQLGVLKLIIYPC